MYVHVCVTNMYMYVLLISTYMFYYYVHVFLMYTYITLWDVLSYTCTVKSSDTDANTPFITGENETLWTSLVCGWVNIVGFTNERVS